MWCLGNVAICPRYHQFTKRSTRMGNTRKSGQALIGRTSVKGPDWKARAAAVFATPWRRPHERRWFLCTGRCWERAASSPRTTTGETSCGRTCHSGGWVQTRCQRLTHANVAANGYVYISLWSGPIWCNQHACRMKQPWSDMHCVSGVRISVSSIVFAVF